MPLSFQRDRGQSPQASWTAGNARAAVRRVMTRLWPVCLVALVACVWLLALGPGPGTGSSQAPVEERDENGVDESEPTGTAVGSAIDGIAEASAIDEEAEGAGAAVGEFAEIRAALPVEDPEFLAELVESGDGKKLEWLFEWGVSPEKRLPNGDTPLLAAVRAKRAEMVALCLRWCEDVDAQCAEGATALTLAVVTSQRHVAQFLIAAGADPNRALPGPAPDAVREAFDAAWFLTQMKYDPGLTPLMLATVLGDEDLVRLFLGHGGKPHQRTDRYKMDAVTLACRAGQIRVGQRLLQRDPDEPEGQKLVILLGEQRATLFRGSEPVLTSKVSTGRKGFATPTGEFLITSKHRDWTSTIYKVPMPYLLRLNASDIGLHQGALPGYPASHGCIRLPAGKAVAFFKIARIGDRVLIRP